MYSLDYRGVLNQILNRPTTNILRFKYLRFLLAVVNNMYQVLVPHWQEDIQKHLLELLN